MAGIPPEPPPDRVGTAATLLRRIPHLHVKNVGDGSPRLTSQAFDPPHGGDSISVYVEETLRDLGLDMDAVLVGHGRFGLMAFPAAEARDAGLTVVWAPDPDDGLRGQAHANVTGTFSQSVRKRLRDAAEIRRLPVQP